MMIKVAAFPVADRWAITYGVRVEHDIEPVFQILAYVNNSIRGGTITSSDFTTTYLRGLANINQL